MAWLLARLHLRQETAAFWYEQMTSQSGRSLPVIYLPFDLASPGHWADRGAILDFAAHAGGGRILDFGPGDGWPTLLLAPFVREVVGVDASPRRVDVCRENARRLGIENARFVHLAPGEPLPLLDESCDAVVAASSVEQAPEPRRVLAEFARVLRRGGRLRMHYESLGYYRGARERQVTLGETPQGQARLLLLERHPDEEYTRHVALVLDRSVMDVQALLGAERGPTYSDLTPERLQTLTSRVVDAATWTTQHPRCATWLEMLREAGFAQAKPTHDGAAFARALFDRWPREEWPQSRETLDALLRPLVKVIVTLAAPAQSEPGHWDPWITAWR
jgi:SAM-dependent methyltransferase